MQDVFVFLHFRDDSSFIYLESVLQGFCRFQQVKFKIFLDIVETIVNVIQDLLRIHSGKKAQAQFAFVFIGSVLFLVERKTEAEFKFIKVMLTLLFYF